MRQSKPFTDKELEVIRGAYLDWPMRHDINRLIATIDELKTKLESAEDEIAGWIENEYEQRICD